VEQLESRQVAARDVVGYVTRRQPQPSSDKGSQHPVITADASHGSPQIASASKEENSEDLSRTVRDFTLTPHGTQSSGLINPSTEGLPHKTFGQDLTGSSANFVVLVTLGAA
jgi:hypothetical protein